MQSPLICDAHLPALEIARQVLQIEIEGIQSVMGRLNEKFDECVDHLYYLRGRIIITGVGKSGLMARKIAATLTRTGTPAIFVHPVEGLHGDLGIVTRDDALVALSNSGETPEITSLAATIKKRGPLIIAITGVASSALARMADLVLDCRVPREACPLNMAPTASTTAALSLGDSLAVALMVKRGFRKEDFLRHHPAGSLGERLNLKVRDIMLRRPVIPEVGENASLQEVIGCINRQNLGFALVTRGDQLMGIITDGDLRRFLATGDRIYESRAEALMTASPLTIRDDRTAAEALEIMERKLITALAVLDEKQKLAGIIHLHDLLGKGEIRFTP
ncbi:MAG: KpsF/GutQ family sugar-phosphate isomerase [Desulfomonile tiedjei]|uniref:KpsF/GutQ family sugar-phosphate isomerase n=1 Tax=Desulfomonile tiedjei TaxID=2358 RepID=A0A9D6Z188_9BACT|nr:KpsF/GutQ family sugar-phosphate isomerase [Desulfomonile tiedjei]